MIFSDPRQSLRHLLLAMLFVAPTMAGIARADRLFSDPVNYPVGDFPICVVAADVNGDGSYDLVVARHYANCIAVLKNNGDGTFQPKVDFPIGGRPHYLFVADFNGDGPVDIAAVNLDDGLVNCVMVLRGNGDGTFQAPERYAVGDHPRSVFGADFNGDGYVDLVTADEISNTITVLKNVGDGTFLLQSTCSVSLPYSLCADDIDRDGDKDVAVTGGDGVTIMKNNGAGAFQASGSYETGGSSISVVIADLSQAGSKDLAVANFTSDNISVVKNKGDGTFEGAVNYPVGSYPVTVIAADLDGDGGADLAVANESYYSDSSPDSVSVLINKGDGTFHPAINYVAGDYPYGLVATDFNGDGALDLAVGNRVSGDISILFNFGRHQPSNFSILSPPDSSGLPCFELLPTLRWTASHDPNPYDTVSYTVELSERPTFTLEYVFDSIGATEFKVPDSLEFGTHYFWRATAKDMIGLSTVSNTADFWTWALGDINHSHMCDLSDLSSLVSYLTGGGYVISPKMVGDVSGDCFVDLRDLSTMVSYLTGGGAQFKVGCE